MAVSLDDTEKADRLQHCVETLANYIAALRGEFEDTTGCGLWDIFCRQQT